MANHKADVLKSYYDGCVKVRLSATAFNRGEDVSSTVTVDMKLEDARAFCTKLADAITKAEEKTKVAADRESRRKAWRDREVAAGRMKIIQF